MASFLLFFSFFISLFPSSSCHNFQILPCAFCCSSLHIAHRPPAPPASSSSLVLSPRNLSSADAGRQTMRNYSGLIDSLMAYVQNCVAASRCDDKVRVQAPGDYPQTCCVFPWLQSLGHTLKSGILLVLAFLFPETMIQGYTF